jgi:hypothetical protein
MMLQCACLTDYQMDFRAVAAAGFPMVLIFKRCFPVRNTSDEGWPRDLTRRKYKMYVMI